MFNPKILLFLLKYKANIYINNIFYITFKNKLINLYSYFNHF